MAWTVREVTARLREEIGARNLVVKLDPARGRFVVCERTRQFGGARSVPFSLTETGELIRTESSVLRTVYDHDDIVYVHEAPDGSYLPLDPNAIRVELLRCDTHRRDVAGEVMRAVHRKREQMDAQFTDEVGERSKYYRRAIAKAWEEA